MCIELFFSGISDDRTVDSVEDQVSTVSLPRSLDISLIADGVEQNKLRTITSPGKDIIRRPLVLGGGSEAADPLKRVTPEILKEEFILDGIHFIGEINYYPDPLFFAIFAIRSAHTQLLGQTCGPSLEEVYELVKSLRVLNRKQVD